MSAPDPDVLDAVARWGRPALAWEALRRDPVYRSAYAALPSPPAPGAAADAGIVTRWGLHFR